MPRTQCGAVPPGSGRAPCLRRSGAEESTAPRRVVVPQLSEIGRMVDPNLLALIRMDAEPGERVAIYTRGRPSGRLEVRALITGPRRAVSLPPRRLPEGWRRLAVVEITDDGERTLPEIVS